MKETDILSAAKWLKGHDINLIAFDVDDTLLDTSKHIRTHTNAWVKNTAEQIGIPEIELHAQFTEYGRQAFQNPEVHVKQIRWQIICDQLAKHFDRPSSQFDHRPILKFYDSAPDIYPETRSTLESLRSHGLHTLAITHSQPHWHQIKMSQHNLSHLFDYHAIINPEHAITKTSTHWRDAITSLGSKPEKTLAVGDGIKPDILASLAAGVIHVVHITPKWDMYKQGEVPKSVHQIDDIAQLIPLLAQL